MSLVLWVGVVVLSLTHEVVLLRLGVVTMELVHLGLSLRLRLLLTVY